MLRNGTEGAGMSVSDNLSGWCYMCDLEYLSCRGREGSGSESDVSQKEGVSMLRRVKG